MSTEQRVSTEPRLIEWVLRAATARPGERIAVRYDEIAEMARDGLDLLDARKERDAALSTVGEMREWIAKHQWQPTRSDDDEGSGLDACPECGAEVYWTQVGKQPLVQHGEHTAACSVPGLLAVPTPAPEPTDG